jgi:hypothetical protein
LTHSISRSIGPDGNQLDPVKKKSPFGKDEVQVACVGLPFGNLEVRVEKKREKRFFIFLKNCNRIRIRVMAGCVVWVRWAPH